MLGSCITATLWLTALAVLLAPGAQAAAAAFGTMTQKERRIRALIEGIAECDKECGGLRPPVLHRHLVPDSRAVCNDGSRASFYMHDARSRYWVISLQPGWLCHDESSCLARHRETPVFTSGGRHSPHNVTGHSVLKTDPSNKLFWRYNMVEIQYCSSDLYLGNSTDTNQFGFAFRGKQILFSTILDLIQNHRLDNGHMLYFVGTSAGGVGILANMEELMGAVGDAGYPDIFVRVILDGAWYTGDMEHGGMGMSCPHNATLPCMTTQLLRNAFDLWGVQLRSRCAREHAGQEWRCIFGSQASKDLEVPMFVIQDHYDKYQLMATSLLPVPQHASSTQFLQYFKRIMATGSRVRSEIESLPPEQNGFFSMACINHNALRGDYTRFPVHIGGRESLISALQCWMTRENATLRSVGEILGGGYRRTPGVGYFFIPNPYRADDGCSYRVTDTCEYPQCNPQCVSLTTTFESPWAPLIQLVPNVRVMSELQLYTESSFAHLADQARLL